MRRWPRMMSCARYLTVRTGLKLAGAITRVRIVAYAARRYEGATRAAVGQAALLLTCPPLLDLTFDPAMLSGADLVVFNLHGLPGQPVWLGGDQVDDNLPALRAETLARCQLGGAGVFAINCYLGDASDSPMRDALWQAGAGYLVSGAGENFGGMERPAGADVLLKWFRLFLERGLSPARALSLARVICRVVERGQVAEDTLAFGLERKDAITV